MNRTFADNSLGFKFKMYLNCCRSLVNLDDVDLGAFLYEASPDLIKYRLISNYFQQLSEIYFQAFGAVISHLNFCICAFCVACMLDYIYIYIYIP